MTDLLDEPDPEAPVDRPEPTGVARVDAVIDAVAAAADLPLAEQVVVLDQAHGELRRALDDPGSDEG